MLIAVWWKSKVEPFGRCTCTVIAQRRQQLSDPWDESANDASRPTSRVRAEPEPPRSHYSQRGDEPVREVPGSSDGARQRKEILRAITRKSQKQKNEKNKSHIWQEHSVPLLLVVSDIFQNWRPTNVLLTGHWYKNTSWTWITFWTVH